MFTIFKDQDYENVFMTAETFDEVLAFFDEKDRAWIEKYFYIYAAMEIKGMPYKNYWIEWR